MDGSKRAIEMSAKRVSDCLAIWYGVTRRLMIGGQIHIMNIRARDLKDHLSTEASGARSITRCRSSRAKSAEASPEPMKLGTAM